MPQSISLLRDGCSAVPCRKNGKMPSAQTPTGIFKIFSRKWGWHSGKYHHHRRQSRNWLLFYRVGASGRKSGCRTGYRNGPCKRAGPGIPSTAFVLQGRCAGGSADSCCRAGNLGSGIAKHIFSKRFLICPSLSQKIQTLACYLFPVTMGKLMWNMTVRYESRAGE